MKKAIDAINREGILLVFPVKNRKDTPSLWREFHPRTPLRWEWDEDGDNRVFKMWQLMKELSECRDVVYVKWFQNRATFFSRELFKAIYKFLRSRPEVFERPPSSADLIMETLLEDSPLSTKQLKVLTDLRGKDMAAVYNRGLSWNFARLEIVGFGEADDGAFPSLVVGATKLMYEDLVDEAEDMDLGEARRLIEEHMPKGQPFRKYLDKILARPASLDLNGD